MKKIMFLLALFCIFVAGCEGLYNTNKSDWNQGKMQEKMTSELDKEIGLPNITHFTQKKTMKMIMEECDKENLLCYAYLQSEMSGKLIFIGKCIGYGIPFSAQYTNPMKPINGWPANFQETVIPQADPNGLFMPTSSTATWLLMVDPTTNKPRVTYFEPLIVVSPFPLPCVNS